MKKKKSNRKWWIWAIGILVLLIIIANIDSDEESSTANSEDSYSELEQTELELNSTSEESQETKTEMKSEPEPESPWSYQTTEDEMTGAKRYFASVYSTNQLQFDFPYSGGSTAQLIVRNMKGKNNVLLKIDKGQFITSLGNDEHVRVKFDEGDVKNYSYSSADDGSSDIIFINYSSQFINQLKQADKLMIEAPFYDAGRQVIKFDVSGLEWHK